MLCKRYVYFQLLQHTIAIYCFSNNSLFMWKYKIGVFSKKLCSLYECNIFIGIV